MFDPNSPGPMKVVVEVGNPQYFATRTQELLAEAATCDVDAAVDKIGMAIALLALAKIGLQDEPVATSGQRRT